MKYKKVKNAFLKRKRDLEDSVREPKALVIHKETKEQYYKSAKLVQGAYQRCFTRLYVCTELGAFGQLYPTHACGMKSMRDVML